MPEHHHHRCWRKHRPCSSPLCLVAAHPKKSSMVYSGFAPPLQPNIVLCHSSPARAHQRVGVRMSAAPGVAAPAATKQLTKDDLVKYLASGCKTRDKWRCAASPTSYEQSSRSTSHINKLGPCPELVEFSFNSQ